MLVFLSCLVLTVGMEWNYISTALPLFLASPKAFIMAGFKK